MRAVEHVIIDVVYLQLGQLNVVIEYSAWQLCYLIGM